MDELTRLNEEIDILRQRIYRLSVRFTWLCLIVAGLGITVSVGFWTTLIARD